MFNSSIVLAHPGSHYAIYRDPDSGFLKVPVVCWSAWEDTITPFVLAEPNDGALVAAKNTPNYLGLMDAETALHMDEATMKEVFAWELEQIKKGGE